MFRDKLRKLMDELGLNQTQVCRITGVAASSLSQYLNGDSEPYRKRKREMALALGMQEDYFQELLPEVKVQENSCINLPVTLAAKLMHKSPEFVKKGLQDGVFPWGYAVKMGRWTYWISAIRFSEATGIPLPAGFTGEQGEEETA